MNTRISELISALSSPDSRAQAQLEAMFNESVFGLLTNGLPEAKHGEKHVVSASRPVTLQQVRDPAGKSMIKACADPELFDVNYPGCINATMIGRELLEMARKLPEVDGILICSATSFHSYPIYRKSYARLKEAKAKPTRNWWQFWKSN